MATDLATERSALVTERFPTPNEPNKLKDDFEQTCKMKDSLFLIHGHTYLYSQKVAHYQIVAGLTLLHGNRPGNGALCLGDGYFPYSK